MTDPNTLPQFRTDREAIEAALRDLGAAIDDRHSSAAVRECLDHYLARVVPPPSAPVVNDRMVWRARDAFNEAASNHALPFRLLREIDWLVLRVALTAALASTQTAALVAPSEEWLRAHANDGDPGDLPRAQPPAPVVSEEMVERACSAYHINDGIRYEESSPNHKAYRDQSMRAALTAVLTSVQPKAEAILRELVALKRMHDAVDGLYVPPGSVPPWSTTKLREEYERRKPAAWAAAFKHADGYR